MAGKSKAPRSPRSRARVPFSRQVRAQMRRHIAARVKELGLSGVALARVAPVTVAQGSRLLGGYDAFSLDKLVDVGRALGLRMEIRLVMR